jgi:phosphomannomutase
VQEGTEAVERAAALLASARAWREADPDPETCAELDEVLSLEPSAREPELEDRFGGRLTFGTAGVRGPLGAGPRRMNRLLVRQTTTGLAELLGPGASVVIGHDARRRSDVFALDTARVLVARGLRPMLLPGVVPTPLLAFAVRRLGAEAGVMITASHNPASDNGYKVYRAAGAQITSPDDRRIEEVAAQAGLDVELCDEGDDRIERLGPDVEDAYLSYLAGLVSPGPRDLTAVFTPLHGVGGRLVEAAFARAGFPALDVVARQADPDPAFPTVAFPNPEEPGALDLAIAEADRLDTPLVLATDPDADRFAAAVRRGNEWRILTGDEVGALFADHLLATTAGGDRLVVSTFVSSPLVGVLAAEAGARHIETLTGFKWIMRAVLDHPEQRLVLGYEEALGYAFGDVVRDKDGVAAALLFAELTARAAERGASPLDLLDQIALRHGLYASRSWSWRPDGTEAPAQIAAALGRLLAEPPSALAGIEVTDVVDHRAGGALPPAEAVTLHLADGSRVVVRPSGTEPKLKVYVHVREPVGSADDLVAARASADRRLTAMLQETRSALGAV